MTKISVIIPTHNRPESLFKLLDSLEQQTLSQDDYEVLVVPSPDDTCISLFHNHTLKYKIKITLLTPPNQPGFGQNVSAKRNLGAKFAKADILAFTDDDCYASSEWLKASLDIFKTDISAVEGNTQIPDNEPKTLTRKGSLRLSSPGGYQTCNIFYRKSDFQDIGGFDEDLFPWFLEDTDMAWSFLSAGKKILFSNDAIIYHPVQKAAPWRMIHEARGTERKVLLFKKHPEIYRRKQMKIFRASQYVYLFLWITLFFMFIFWKPKALLITTVLFLLILSGHMLKLFSGCKTNYREFSLMLTYTAIWPIYGITYFFKGCLKQRVSLKDTLYLLRF